MNNVINFPLPPRMPAQNQQAGNPMQMIMSRFRAGMNPLAIAEQLGGPQAQMARQMLAGKNEAQMRQMVINMAKERGIDLNALAQQLGVQISL